MPSYAFDAIIRHAIYRAAHAYFPIAIDADAALRLDIHAMRAACSDVVYYYGGEGFTRLFLRYFFKERGT